MVESATVPPEPVRLLPSASLSWTVIVEVELPSAVIEPGAALIVEVAVEAAPALTVIAAVVPVIVPVTVSVAVTVREPVVLRVTENVLDAVVAADERVVARQGRAPGRSR